MRKVRKGQGAMEYLMTYGWALLVIVVVGAALFALGVLNPSTYTQKRCQGFQYLTYQDHRATGGSPGTVTLDVVNGPRDITVTGMTWNSVALTGVNGTTAPSAGARFTVGGNVNTGTSPNSYSNVVVTVTYDVSGGISGNVDRATCSGTYA